MDSIGVLFLKLMVLAALSPLWFPVVKAIWEEMNLALLDDGGLIGRIPTPAQLERLKKEQAWRPDPIVHEPWAADGRTRRAQRTAPEQPGGRSPSQQNRATSAPRRGF